MPIDASIPLGIKPPDQMQNLSSLLGVAKGAQDLQSQGITLQQRKGMLDYLKSGDAVDPDGSLNTDRLYRNASRFGDTGLEIAKKAAETHQQGTAASLAWNNLAGDKASRIGNAVMALPPGAPPDLVHKTFDALDKQYKGEAGPITTFFRTLYDHADSHFGPDSGRKAIVSFAKSQMTPAGQQTFDTPNGVGVSDGQTASVVSTKPDTSVPQGQALPGTQVTNKVGPGGLESVESDSQGNKFVTSRSPQGTVLGTRPLESTAPSKPGPFTLPQGETAQSLSDLQGQRTAAHAAANSAPVMHDINQTIVREASKGLNTGTLGQLTQKLSSATGYTIGKDEATDYNLLGKMLERSALTAAQSMGPHTNAGLEASIRANGSLEYTPQAIKKIAHLNDALVSGAELYRDGLEKTIGSSPNNIFAKREFDQKWSKVATPQVLRLKNAVDNGNTEEVSSILKEVGGKGSEGARKLHKQLTELLQLAGR